MNMKTTANMSALILNPGTKGERYLALAPGLTWAQVEAFVLPFLGHGERFAGVYSHGTHD
jgi:hypothetical protein